jgi:hypothetical protein
MKTRSDFQNPICRGIRLAAEAEVVTFHGQEKIDRPPVQQRVIQSSIALTALIRNAPGLWWASVGFGGLLTSAFALTQPLD